MAALSRLSTNEELSRSLYRMGFRSLDEVVEASEGELASVPGISADDVAKLRDDAATGMEDLRKERLAAMADRTEAHAEARQASPRARRECARSRSARAERLRIGRCRLSAGEEDTDRLAIKSGLGASKAQALKAAVAAFVETEWPSVDVKMQESIAAAQAVAARLEAAAAAGGGSRGGRGSGGRGGRGSDRGRGRGGVRGRLPRPRVRVRVRGPRRDQAGVTVDAGRHG